MTTTITLDTGYEKKAAPDFAIDGLKFPEHDLLYHQQRTYEALPEHDLVCNTYNTGTGKTLASLLHLFRLNETGKNVLFIAPTNALLAQHAEDIRAFVDQNGLNYYVQPATASRLRTVDADLRGGEILQRFIKNYREFVEGETRRKQLIFVVNPDIFYYALYFQYGRFDQRNVFENFLTRFDYVVIDEFHYYDSKQLANFLFFFAICEQFGYFSHRQRKICLLSATPTEEVKLYLDRLFDNYRWKLIAPDNEPNECRAYETVQTLAPLHLTVIEDDLQSWVRAHRGDLRTWLDDGEDGAIISSALWRINAAHRELRGTLDIERMRRITGPEPAEQRAEATKAPLVLATPTVDIGYNFAKEDKRRQNIDFIVCDARFHDELVQRLGRAGRLLGKSERDRPSHGVALLPGPAANALAEYDGETLSRADFAEIVRGIERLPPKQSLYAYIQSHAITESFYPIYKLLYITRQDLHSELEELYALVRDVFAPNSSRSMGSLKGFFKAYFKRTKWLGQIRNDDETPETNLTARMIADYKGWKERSDTRFAAGDFIDQAPIVLQHPLMRKRLIEFVEEQVALTEALFNFRDSFQGPTAVVYDPRRLLSSQIVNVYDLFHLLRYFHVDLYEGRRQFRREAGAHAEDTDLSGDFYLHMRDPRDEPMNVSLSYHADLDRDDFAEKRCRAPAALKNLHLISDEQVDPRIYEAVADDYIVALILRPNDKGAAYGKLRGTTLYPWDLEVTYPDSGQETCAAYLGTGAFHAHAELRGYFFYKEREDAECIIV